VASVSSTPGSPGAPTKPVVLYTSSASLLLYGVGDTYGRTVAGFVILLGGWVIR
jgi:hypothetical protein